MAEMTVPASAARPGASVPIADYGLLSDCSSAALVSREGSIDWLCLPRFDSPSVFARLLDGDAGHWSIAPAGEQRSERRYLDGTLVVETTFTTGTGTVRLTDALAFPEGQRGHDVGKDAPHELLRSIEGVDGEVELVFELAPRAEYGLVRPLIRVTDEGARTFGGPNRIKVSSPVALELADATLGARFTVAAGEHAGFALRWAPVESTAHDATPPERVPERIADVAEGWRSWEAE